VQNRVFIRQGYFVGLSGFQAEPITNFRTPEIAALGSASLEMA